jgi:hypothetical protein
VFAATIKRSKPRGGTATPDRIVMQKAQPGRTADGQPRFTQGETLVSSLGLRPIVAMP